MAPNPRHPPAASTGPSGRVAALAVGAVFFANGATFSSWTPRLPELQRELGISDDRASHIDAMLAELSESGQLPGGGGHA